jgi:hypothetical protein
MLVVWEPILVTWSNSNKQPLSLFIVQILFND